MAIKPQAEWLPKITQFGEMMAATRVTDQGGSELTIENGIDTALALLSTARKAGNRVFVIGNGGSAAVASHIVNDFVNCGNLRATVVHDPSLLTCMANDYGYENAYARILKVHAGSGDVLVAISSSGNSANIRRSAEVVHELGGQAITLSGFASANPLRAMGKLNFWLDSRHYGFVEIGHLYLLHHILDRFKDEGA